MIMQIVLVHFMCNNSLISKDVLFVLDDTADRRNKKCALWDKVKL